MLIYFVAGALTGFLIAVAIALIMGYQITDDGAGS